MHDEKVFCCSGCKVVYEILQQNDLCHYYALEQSPGISPSAVVSSRFAYLDDATVVAQLLDYSDDVHSTVVLTLPTIHCSSCIWLLEQLYKLDAGIVSSRVDFLKKSLSVKFLNNKTSLQRIVILLSSIGYEPELRLDASDKKRESDRTRKLYYKIGVAGFCFGNSMLFSFPEYLGYDASEELLRSVFSYLNLLLGIPVFFYCGADYFTSAVGGLRKKIINIDVPIALGILLLFGRSVYEITAGVGPGFIDSLCGLLFFLLLGRIFQSKTYDRLNFERNYTSYFPLSVTVRRNGEESTIPLSSLQRGNRIVIRHGEIIPADAMLLQGSAAIDYSFVTGESAPVEKVLGEMIYAGGRQQGGKIELEVMKEVSQSYLTQLWNNYSASTREEGRLVQLSNTVSKYFTVVVLFVSIGVLFYWLPKDVTTAINAFTGILIVACPCALAIAIPFTFGTALRIFGRNHIYLKNTAVIESMAKIDTLVFDKTGTITYPHRSSVEFVGTPLTEKEQRDLSSLVSNSIHPVSRLIASCLPEGRYPVEQFEEQIGQGISGIVQGTFYRFGTRTYAGSDGSDPTTVNETRSYLSVDGLVKGYFSVKNLYREGLGEMIETLKNRYSLAVISGDNDSERLRLQQIFPSGTTMRFQQTPTEKRDFVRSQQSTGARVMMFGDGLNDAGALLHSDLGVAVTEDITHFSPASDAILQADKITLLPTVLRFAATSMRIVIASFVMAFLYNVVGIYFALQGQLTPILAAILMPASSITIVVFTTVATQAAAKRRGLL